MGSRIARALILCVWVASLCELGCQNVIECSAEVTAGNGTFKGTAKGEVKDSRPLRRQAVLNACMNMCKATLAAEKSSSFEACAPRCMVDIEAGKVGAKIGCTSEH